MDVFLPKNIAVAPALFDTIESGWAIPFHPETIISIADRTTPKQKPRPRRRVLPPPEPTLDKSINYHDTTRRAATRERLRGKKQ